MNYLKKFLASTLLLTLLGATSTNISYAEKINTVSPGSIVKIGEELKNIKNGPQYIVQVQAFYARIGNDEEKIRIINQRLETIIDQISEDEYEKSLLVGYIAAKNNDVIIANNYDIPLTSFNTIYTKNDFIIDDSLVQSITIEPEIVALTGAEKAEVATEVLKFQEIMLDSSLSSMEKMLKEIERQSQYTETGNFNIKGNIDLESTGKIRSEIDVSDYEFKNDYLNSHFRGAIEAMVESDNVEIDTDFSVSTFVDLIQKDGSIYVLLENLEVEQSSVVENYFLEGLKTIGQEESYVRFGNDYPNIILNMLESLNPKSLADGVNKMKSTPMMTAYGKSEDTIILVPSKQACDIMKELMSVFDPFNGDECTESQYKDMLTDYLEEDIKMYMILGATTEVGILSPEINVKTVYSDETLLSLNLVLSQEYEGDIMTLDYTKQEALNMQLNTPTLEISSEIDLKNGNINGTFYANMSEYDYFTGDYTPSNKIDGTIRGQRNSDNSLNNLSINITGNDLIENTQPMNIDLDYSQGEMYVGVDYNDENNTLDLALKTKWNPNTGDITGGSLDIIVLGKETEFDYTTYEMIYIGEKEKAFSSNIILSDKTINGTTNLYDYGKEVMTINHTGTYTPGMISSENSFELFEAPLSLGEDESTDTLNGNIDFNYSYTDFTNTFNLLFEVFMGDKNIIDVKVENDSSREYNKPYIEAPEEYIDIYDIY